MKLAVLGTCQDIASFAVELFNSEGGQLVKTTKELKDVYQQLSALSEDSIYLPFGREDGLIFPERFFIRNFSRNKFQKALKQIIDALKEHPQKDNIILTVYLPVGFSFGIDI